jgi:hypothetical protein
MYLKIDGPSRRRAIARFKYAAALSYAKLYTPHNKQKYTYNFNRKFSSNRIIKVKTCNLLLTKRNRKYSN